MPISTLELLAPAKNITIGKAAITHGADAVYIGGPAFSARYQASNAIEEIAELTTFAHRYHAKIFVAFNTIFHDQELEEAERLIQALFHAEVDALIIQDMAVLELNLPPIALHASTQCDIRTPAKAKFLADVGLSQLVLARELSLAEIKETQQAVGEKAVLEYFIHGALCVAFSGQCYMSHAETGRSANRGDCSQPCRLPYTLRNAAGEIIAYDKYLLSMKDNDQTNNLEALITAGIRSFKIEGRYKDINYVKNITAHYRQQLDAILAQRPDLKPASSGRVQYAFVPDPQKTFQRGSTDYFAHGRQENNIAAFDSPKFLGIPIAHIITLKNNRLGIKLNDGVALRNGDGVSFLYRRESKGFTINAITEEIQVKQEKIYWLTPNDSTIFNGLDSNALAGQVLYRNRDHAWEESLKQTSAERRLGVRFSLQENQNGLILQAIDEDGIHVTQQFAVTDKARQPEKLSEQWQVQLSRLGDSLFYWQGLDLSLKYQWFVPVSQMNQLRRETLDALMAARLRHYVRPTRQPSLQPAPIYPWEQLSYLSNVYNKLARNFYERHGVKIIDPAFEAHQEDQEVSLMITKHCLRFSFQLCPKQAKGITGVQGQIRAEPLFLSNGQDDYTLTFDCRSCEMHIRGKMKKNIIKQIPPGAQPITFFSKK
jgi:putative protease